MDIPAQGVFRSPLGGGLPERRADPEFVGRVAQFLIGERTGLGYGVIVLWPDQSSHWFMRSRGCSISQHGIEIAAANVNLMGIIDA